jgi:hypothetical protein
VAQSHGTRAPTSLASRMSPASSGRADDCQCSPSCRWADTDPLGGGFVDVKIQLEEELPDHLELSLPAKRPEVNAGDGKRILFSGNLNPAEQELAFFWKAYLSIKQPLTAHDPIHPRSLPARPLQAPRCSSCRASESSQHRRDLFGWSTRLRGATNPGSSTDTLRSAAFSAKMPVVFSEVCGSASSTGIAVHDFDLFISEALISW